MAKKMTYEQSVQRLDEIVRSMEKGDAPLEEALKLASATGGDVAGSAGIGSLSRVTGYLPGLTVKTVRPGKDKSI